LRCQRPVYPPNFVAYQAGPVHTECVQQQAIQSNNVSSTPAWAIPLAITAMVAAVFIILLSVNGSSQTANMSPTIQVDAKDLYEHYRTNEVRADAIYKGKRVAVRGIAGNVQKTVFDDVYVEVRSGIGLDLNSLQCYAGSGQKTAFGAIQAGKPVRLNTRIEGLTLGHIMGRDCIVMR